MGLGAKKSGWSSTPTAGLTLDDCYDGYGRLLHSYGHGNDLAEELLATGLARVCYQTRFMTEWMHIMQRKAEHRTVTSAFGPTEQTEMATMVD